VRGGGFEEEWKRAGLSDGINRIIAYATLFLVRPVVWSIGLDELLPPIRFVIGLMEMALVVLIWMAIARLLRYGRASGHVFVYIDGVQGLYGERAWRFSSEKARSLRLRPVLRSVRTTRERGLRFRCAGILAASLLIPIPDRSAESAEEIALYLDRAAQCGSFPEKREV
jgi:hypothetical protein